MPLLKAVLVVGCVAAADAEQSSAVSVPLQYLVASVWWLLVKRHAKGVNESLMVMANASVFFSRCHCRAQVLSVSIT